MKKQIITTSLTFLLTILLFSCKKGWLEAKPQKLLVVPNSIEDYQALLDDASSPNGDGMNVNQAALDEIGAGDFFMTDQNWESRTPRERNAYIWASGDFYEGGGANDWNYTYKRIFTANVVLEGVEKINPKDHFEQIAWNNVKGAALFFRAYNHYTIAQLFCKPFVEETADTDLGIPLRLTANFNEVSIRSSVKITYDQIISDLEQARVLLSIEAPNNDVNKIRPTRTAANAMLARAYLSMSQYDKALVYADNCLQSYSTLIDYNSIPNIGSNNAPFLRLNPEVIFHMELINYASFSTSRLIVDTNLYKSYSSDDLRKDAFFRNMSGSNYTFKGKYNTSTNLFGGLATDEIYLIRAECYARKGDTASSMRDLNILLKKRWKPAAWLRITAIDAADAINKTLTERKKELCFRGLRWTDLRRLNMEQQQAITLTRMVKGQMHTITPKSDKYVLPIPDNIILLSGMQQNPR